MSGMAKDSGCALLHVSTCISELRCSDGVTSGFYVIQCLVIQATDHANILQKLFDPDGNYLDSDRRLPLEVIKQSMLGTCKHSTARKRLVLKGNR